MKQKIRQLLAIFVSAAVLASCWARLRASSERAFLLTQIKNVEAKPAENSKPLIKEMSLTSPSLHSRNNGEGKLQLHRLIAKEAIKLYQFNEDPGAADKRISGIAKLFSANQIKELETLAIDEKANADERIAAVYYLKAAGAKAQSSLQKIFENPTSVFNQPVPAHSVSEMHVNLEISLRTMALQGLDANIQASAGQLHAAVLQNSSLPVYLQQLYKMLVAGDRIHQPLLQQFMQQSLSQESL